MYLKVTLRGAQPWSYSTDQRIAKRGRVRGGKRKCVCLHVSVQRYFFLGNVARKCMVKCETRNKVNAAEELALLALHPIVMGTPTVT